MLDSGRSIVDATHTWSHTAAFKGNTANPSQASFNLAPPRLPRVGCIIPATEVASFSHRGLCNIGAFFILSIKPTFSLPPPGGSLPPPGGLDHLRAFSVPSLVCVGGVGVSCVAFRSLGRLTVRSGSSNEMPCHTNQCLPRSLSKLCPSSPHCPIFGTRPPRPLGRLS